MELESVEIVNYHEEKVRSDCGKAPLTKLTIQLSHSSDSARTRRVDHLSALDESGVPGLQASMTSSSSSSFPDEPSDSSRKATSKPLPSSDEAQCPVDMGCMTDRMVRFFCPFDTPCPSHADFKRKHQKAFEENLMICNDSVVPSTNHDCSNGSWVCVPGKWESSPERVNLGTSKQNIRNRCSTLEASKRKADYIKTIRNHWHNADCDFPLQATRSEGVGGHTPLHEDSLSSVPSAYYDSDPEIQIEPPKYKKNRPAALNLGVDDDDVSDSEWECPQVPRHSSKKLMSFFDSPRSVAEPVDLHDDENVRSFIQVSSS